MTYPHGVLGIGMDMDRIGYFYTHLGSWNILYVDKGRVAKNQIVHNSVYG